MVKNYEVKVNYSTRDIRERTNLVSRKLVEIINLTVNIRKL